MIYATDINPRALQKAEAGVYDIDRIAGFTDNHRKSGAKSSLSDYYTAAYGRAVFDKTLQQHIVFSDHSLATDSVFAEVQLVSCRNVLIYFDRELAGPRRRAVRGRAVPQGLSRHRRQGIAAVLPARGAFAELVARGSHLPEARRRMTTLDVRLRRVDAVVIGTSAGGVEALSEMLPALPAGLRRADLRRAAPAARAAEPAGRDFRAEMRACRCARHTTRSRSSPAPSISRRPTTTCSWTTGPQVVLSVDDLVHFSRPSVDVLFESAADVYGDRLLASS